MANDKLKTFEYDGNQIAFDFGDGKKMINATQMAKGFPKIRGAVNQFFRLKQTANFISALHNLLIDSRNDNSRIDKIRSFNAENLSNQFPDLIKVVKGGNLPQGTWVHEKIALKFAAYLNPYFELWIYDVVQSVLLEESKNEQLRSLQFHIEKITNDVESARIWLDTIPFQNSDRNRLALAEKWEKERLKLEKKNKK